MKKCISKICMTVISVVLVLNLTGCSVLKLEWDHETIAELIRIVFIGDEEAKRYNAYTTKFINLLVENNQCTMGEVFDDFEWDYAFVIKENFESGESLAKKLGVDVDVPSVESHDVRRIAFIKGEELVYVHYRNIFEFIIEPEGIIINPDSLVACKNYTQDDGEYIFVAAEFVGEYEYY